MKHDKNLYALILAGGNGERLWPLSRQEKPKQLLTIDENRSLLEDTVSRISGMVDKKNIWVVTTQQHADSVASLIQEEVGLVTIEPQAKNTGPAILFNCLVIHADNPDAVIMILPSDHYIPQTQTFIEFMTHAVDIAKQQEKIVIFGARPTYAATGYGYIEYDQQQSFPCDVIKFHEKPAAALAQQYIASNAMLWNVGVFCARASVFIEEFKKHAPQLYEAIKNYWLEGQSYEHVPAISVDYAVIEKSSNVVVLPVNFVWCDVGNLDTFLALRSKYKKDSFELVEVDSHNNLVEVNNRLVALVGVNNICVVESEGILLIAKRDETEKVKLVLETLKYNNSDEYL
jgi:mannose-1-phosphate guanylyltransferase